MPEKPIIPRATFVAVGATFVALLSVFVPIVWLKFVLLGGAVIMLGIAGAGLATILKQRKQNG